ncbi:MAG TPA: hypothetical protein PLG15_00255 [Candidatus Gastranaerophilaceae bacterium]|nr:hypothetical protein [Candidatus Gastranaerophilaceae bacterium]HPT40798.1 hypothetical protein [Candidatus Gastranaerophilaceae bacterium]
MIRVEPTTSATPPNVPQTPVPAPAPAKPSFKGERPDTAEFESMRAEYQNLSNETSGLLSKIGKAGFLVLTGLIGYKTSKWGLQIVEKQAVKMVNAEKTQKIISSVSGFAKDKVATKSKSLATSVLNFGKEKVMPLIAKGFKSIKNLKFVNKISNIFDTVALKSMYVMDSIKKSRAVNNKVSSKIIKAVSNSLSFVKNKSAKVWDFSKGMTVKAKENMPTGTQIKNTAYETIAVSTGFATAMEGVDIANAVDEAA